MRYILEIVNARHIVQNYVCHMDCIYSLIHKETLPYSELAMSVYPAESRVSIPVFTILFLFSFCRGIPLIE